MAENAPPPLPPSSSSVPPPPIAFPTHTSIHNLFPPAPTSCPGPMALLSSFFSENDPDNECDSFSQLLAGAMSSPGFGAPSNVRQNFFPQLESGDFRFQQNWLVASHTPGMFAIPPGLSPASLLQSPGIFSSSSQVSGQAQAQPQAQKQIQSEYTSLSTPSVPPSQPLASNSSLHKKMPPLLEDVKMDSTDMPLPDQKPQSLNVTVDKPANDGYNWRKYGQKQVKGSEFPRSYYKCTHLNCPVKKKVERSPEGQITEIIYKGQHNHPAPNKHAKDTRNSNGTINGHAHESSVFEGQLENMNNLKEGVPYLSSVKDQESSQVTPDHVSGSSDSEEVGNVETRVDERDEDEPEFKRRNVEVQSSEQHATNHRTVTEPRIIVQTTSEVDLLDDGYRWRKYGQKVVKGNPNPRSYYKCTNPGCNVRKHIERAASDPKAVITTYEGKHNHDVPAAKTNSHNITSSQPRPQVGRPIANVRMEFGEKGQQPVALLRFKEEQNIAFL